MQKLCGNCGNSTRITGKTCIYLVNGCGNNNPKWKPEEVEKTCRTCKYTCTTVKFEGQYCTWKPKEPEPKVEKSCDNCKYDVEFCMGIVDECYNDEKWEPKEQVTNVTKQEMNLTGDSSMSKEQNYEAIVQAVDEDGKIVGKIKCEDSSAIMHVVGTDPQEVRDLLNRKYSTEIDALKKKGEVEFIIRPFLAS